MIKRGGYTLIELIIVIGIIAILSSIAVLNIGSFTSDAKANANQATIKVVEQAIEITRTNLNESFDVSSDIHINELNNNLENITFTSGSTAKAGYDSNQEIHIESDLNVLIIDK